MASNKARRILMDLAVKGVIPVIGGCAGALAAGPVGGAVGGAVGVAAGAAAGEIVKQVVVLCGKAVAELWAKWFKSHPKEEALKALAEVAKVSEEDARDTANEVIENSPLASASDEIKTAVLDYVTSIPRSVQRSLLTDRKGVVSLPRTVSLDDAESLLQLLPTDIPPYRAPCRLTGTEYRLEKLIATSGFGAVYKGTHPDMPHLELVIKFCLNPAAKASLVNERENLEKLRLAASWPTGVVRLYGYNLDHPTPFLVYEYAKGGDLVRWLAVQQRDNDGRPPSPESVLTVIRLLIGALATAHKLGMVHRDLKPANVVIADGKPKLTDFGIGGVAVSQARATGAGSTSGASRSPAETAGLFRGSGTPLYMSEEQERGDKADARHDIYSLGVIWYQLLVGDVTRRVPHGYERKLEMLSVPKAHIDLIKRCVGLFEERPRDARELLEEMQNLREDEVAPDTEELERVKFVNRLRELRQRHCSLALGRVSVL